MTMVQIQDSTWIFNLCHFSKIPAYKIILGMYYLYIKLLLFDYYLLFLYFRNNSNSNCVETTSMVHTLPDASNESQRDLLTNLLNESKVDCVICYERAKNVEQIWNCRNCFQIMHLKCIMVWFIKSQSSK